MNFKITAFLLIPLAISILAGCFVTYVMYVNSPAYERRNDSPYLTLDPGTKYDEKTRVLYSTSWRFCITMPGRPTKLTDMPLPLWKYAQAGFYQSPIQSPDVSYLAAPLTESSNSSPIDPRPRTHNRTSLPEVELSPTANEARYQCKRIVAAIKGKESVGRSVSLGGIGYQGYYSEGFCKNGQYYKAETFIDDENQSTRIVPFFLLVKGKYELVNSKQTDEFFNSFRILPRSSDGKI